MASTTLVFDPTAPRPTGEEHAWHALDRLAGTVVGVIDNAKPNFNTLADGLSDLLINRYGVKRVIRHQKRAATIPAPEEFVTELERECDLVITGLGD